MLLLTCWPLLSPGQVKPGLQYCILSIHSSVSSAALPLPVYGFVSIPISTVQPAVSSTDQVRDKALRSRAGRRFQVLSNYNCTENCVSSFCLQSLSFLVISLSLRSRQIVSGTREVNLPRSLTPSMMSKLTRRHLHHWPPCFSSLSMFFGMGWWVSRNEKGGM